MLLQCSIFLILFLYLFLPIGKQKGPTSSTDIDSKMASSGLTEKQLQLSVEVWKNKFVDHFCLISVCFNGLEHFLCFHSGVDVSLVFGRGFGGRSQHSAAAIERRRFHQRYRAQVATQRRKTSGIHSVQTDRSVAGSCTIHGFFLLLPFHVVPEKFITASRSRRHVVGGTQRIQLGAAETSAGRLSFPRRPR